MPGKYLPEQRFFDRSLGTVIEYAAVCLTASEYSGRTEAPNFSISSVWPDDGLHRASSAGTGKQTDDYRVEWGRDLADFPERERSAFAFEKGFEIFALIAKRLDDRFIGGVKARLSESLIQLVPRECRRAGGNSAAVSTSRIFKGADSPCNLLHRSMILSPIERQEVSAPS